MSAEPFQPTLLGTCVSFEGEDGEGMITDETETQIYVESAFFTGWMSKELFYRMTEESWEKQGDES